MGPRPGLRRGTEGQIQVVEAVLVATIILTSILFFSLIQRTSPSDPIEGPDLDQAAADTLRVLEADTVSGDDLVQWVTKVMQGDATAAAQVDARIEALLPDGYRYRLSLNNGFAPLPILPDPASSATPRAGGAAETFFLADENWTQQTTPVYPTVDETVYPGGPNATTLSGAVCILDPLGVSTAPNGTDWIDVWDAAAAGSGSTPAAVPFGVWAFVQTGTCLAPLSTTYVRVTLPDGTATDLAPYGLQLVVWPGA